MCIITFICDFDQDDTSYDKKRDGLFSDAMIAEMEASVYGLQV